MAHYLLSVVCRLLSLHIAAIATAITIRHGRAALHYPAPPGAAREDLRRVRGQAGVRLLQGDIRVLACAVLPCDVMCWHVVSWCFMCIVLCLLILLLSVITDSDSDSGPACHHLSVLPPTTLMSLSWPLSLSLSWSLSLSQIKPGNPLDAGTLLGPLHNEGGVQEYLEGLEEIKKQGGKVGRGEGESEGVSG